MTRRREEEDNRAAATGQPPMTDEEIIKEVLGRRSGYCRGFGYGMPIPQHRRDYYEQPRDEDLVHSDRSGLERKVDQMQDQINMLMNYIRAPSMPSFGQPPSHHQPAPHMGTSSSGLDPSQPSFTPFTPAAPPPQPYHGFYGMPSQPAGFTHAPHDPPQGSPGSSAQQRGQPPLSGFAPWSGGVGFGQFSSQAPPFGSYPFQGMAPPPGPSSSQFPPQYPPQPSAYYPSPPSTSSATATQTTTMTGSSRSRQRQIVRR